jgi:hypothetical protein
VDAWHNALAFTRSLLQAVADWVSTKIQQVLGFVRLVLAVHGIFLDAFGRARDAVFQKVGELLGFVQSIPVKIWGFLSGLASSLWNLGWDMISGLIKGIKSGAGRIKDALLSILPGPLKQFAGMLGISSPSKVFAKFGTETGRGYILGVRGQRAGVRAAIASLVPRAASISRLLTPADLSGPLAAGTARPDRVEELLQAVVDAVERVAPGVGSELNGATAGTFQLARARG